MVFHDNSDVSPSPRFFEGLQSKSCDFSTPDLQARTGLRSREDGTEGGMHHRQVSDLRAADVANPILSQVVSSQSCWERAWNALQKVLTS